MKHTQTEFEDKRPSENIPPQEDAATQQPPAPKPRRRWWLRIAVVLTAVFSALAFFVYWLIGTESGLRFGVYKLPAWFGVNITSKNLKGTLLDGFDGDKWRIETAGADLDIGRISFAWQPKALLKKKLHINHIVLGDIHIDGKSTPPKERKPSEGLPKSVNLPFEVVVEKLEVGSISTGKAERPSVFLQHLTAAYRYNHQLHHLSMPEISLPWATAGGEFSLGVTTPFKLTGSLTGSGELDGEPIDTKASMWGSLDGIQADVALNGNNLRLNANTALHPFREKLNEKIDLIQIKGFNINPHAFITSLPKARLEFDASVVPLMSGGKVLEGSIDLANVLAAPVEDKGIPVRTLLGGFTVDDNGAVHIGKLDASLMRSGSVSLSGHIDTAGQKLDLAAQLADVGINDIAKQKLEGRLNGTVYAKGTFNEPEVNWLLDSGFAKIDGKLGIQADVKDGQKTLLLHQARLLPNKGGEMNLRGKLELFQKQILKLAVDSKNFNPSKFHPQLPPGSINGTIDVDGVLADQRFGGKMKFGQSTLSGVPLSGTADVLYENQHLSRALTNILLGQNSIKTNGSFGKRGDRLNIDVNAPDLARFGFGLSGLVTAKGYISGEPKKLEANIDGRAQNLRVQNAVQINQLDFKLQGSPDYAAPLNVTVKGNKIVIPGKSAPTVIDAVDMQMRGTGYRHSIRGGGNMVLSGKPYKLDINADGGLNDKNQWKGSVGILDISGAFNLKLQNRMNLEAGEERVVMSAARWSAMGGQLNLDSFLWDKKNGIMTKGNAQNLAVSQLHNFYTPPVEHNLVLSGDWDLSYSQNARGYLNIRRQSGDVVLPHRKQMLGLGNFSLNTRFQSGRIDSVLNGVTAYGNVDGNVVISQQFGNDISLAPINGKISIGAPDLERFRNFLPLGQTLRGNLLGVATIGGRVGQPLLNGTLNGDNLYYRNRDLGLILDKGTLRSRMQGQKWLIDSLRFHRGGTVDLKGSVGFSGATPDVNVSAVFDHYQTLDQANRRLTLSGNADLVYTEKNGVGLVGKLRADSGHFGFQKSSMPTLDDDVVVLGEKPKEKSAPLAINMDLLLDLNDNVRFSGAGLDVTLGGQLSLKAKPGQDVQGIGTVKVVKGRYKAYGQDLDITKGNISFVGPLANPNLNIRAERRLSAVGAGVEVLGNLNSPRITLVANEPMSEKDKLSWLILNRASSGSDGDEAALSAAAGAFLAGSINDKIGLVDDLGFTSKRSRNAQTGELNAAEQVLTVGKQLTNELYLGYEYGVNSAQQSVKVVYQLTRALQAVARVGSLSWGGELKYTVRFD
ncbi:translocation/assembly module TamB domain-containing protein [Neisseria weaveri]|uniref:translocation/assembly module TamB domain-containing protein n=1 Tax=Neisseria weaveri TaxID=28091 RepID=UPI0002232932|nr:translocation/assembly module TamB domain-containing protein [Neisseria weaveri]EGV37962.1 hypothetical protein l13_02120 [Neisseria weaveri ATCC 51223]